MKEKDSYEIIIKKKKVVTVLEAPQYQQVGTMVMSPEEFEKLSGYGFKEIKAENAMKPEYGYPPKREVEKVVEIQVLSQTVEDLNLKAVIKAINNLP